MASRKAHSGLATTFRPDEVEALCAVFDAALVGRDVQQVLRSESIATLRKKFFQLRLKARRPKKDA